MWRDAVLSRAGVGDRACRGVRVVEGRVHGACGGGHTAGAGELVAARRASRGAVRAPLLAHGYSRTATRAPPRVAGGFRRRCPPAAPRATPLPAFGPAGGLTRTVGDPARYARWQLDERDPVVRLAHRPPDPRAPRRGYATALNWQLLRTAGGTRRLWQDGVIAGHAARVVLYPELAVAVVVLVNQVDRTVPPRLDASADTILEALGPRTFGFEEGMRADAGAPE